MTTMQPKPIDEDKALPPFRSDLQIFRGPDESDGTPTYNVLDPIRGQFYKIHWAESQILRFYKNGMSIKELKNAIAKHTTLRIDSKEIVSFFEQASRSNLLAIPRPSREIQTEYDKTKHNWLKWILLNYLFIRIPLVNPDKFLAKALPYVRILVSKTALIIYFVFTVIGIILLINRFDEFLNTFTYFFNLQGIIVYGLALTMVKIVHELAHAFTAKYYNVTVPSVGIALLVLWPVLFTNVTDSWKLVSRKKRLMISCAGVVAELIIAGLCTFGWAVSQPGILQSVFFVIASATWITSLLVNINPAMRFDGYYILSDLWGVDNLMLRAFAVTRWKIRNWLWGLNLPPPEEDLSQERIIGMIIYSIYTWIYRLFLYTAVAVFVYLKFTKALGIFLFFLEIIVFIAWPIAWEIGELIKLKPAFSKNIRLYLTILASSLFLMWFILPLRHQIWFPAITVARMQQVVYAPYDSLIKNIFIVRGQYVVENDPLIEFTSSTLLTEIKAAQAEVKANEQDIHVIQVSKGIEKGVLPEKISGLRVVETQLKGLMAKKDNLFIRADTSGIVYYLDEYLRVGQGVSTNQELAKIANINEVDVVCYIPENLVYAIKKDNQQAKFWLSGWQEKIPAKLVRINDNRETYLEYPQLASIYNGYIPVVEDATGRGKLLLVESYFSARFNLDKNNKPVKFGMLGYIIIDGPPRSYFVYLVQEILRIFWQESGV